jgi:hypothetical protein
MSTHLTTPSRADRRESIRVNMELMVRSYDRVAFEPASGDISLGGARLRLGSMPRDNMVEVLLQRLEDGSEVRLQGDILSVRPHSQGGFDARVRFVEQDLKDELALARMLHQVEKEWDAWGAEDAVMTAPHPGMTQ